MGAQRDCDRGGIFKGLEHFGYSSLQTERADTLPLCNCKNIAALHNHQLVVDEHHYTRK